MLIIVDVDQTLADCSHRVHLVECENPDWNKFLSPELLEMDVPSEGSVEGIKNLIATGNKIVFLTGRNEGLRESTKQWLLKYYNVEVTDPSDPKARTTTSPLCALIMRPIGDQSLPTDFKRRELNKLVYWGFPNWVALDDDPYMQQVYYEFNALPLLAPECWKVMYHFRKDLPEEKNWRK